MNAEPLILKLETEFPADEKLAAQWDRLAIETEAPVYMSFDWLKLWWQFYGKNCQLRLFLFSAGDSLVGIVPVYLTWVGFPPFKVKVARLVGANVPPKVFNPPVMEPWSYDIWSTVLRHLFERDRCDVVSLGPVSETYKGLPSLKETALNGRLPGVAAVLTERDVHTVYHLPKNSEEFFASLDSKERKVRRKKLRDLEAKGPLRVDVLKDPASVEREFGNFVRQHTTQWEAEGRPGHFHAWPHALEFHRELVKAQSKLQRVRLMTLFVAEENIATQYCFAFGKHLYAELPSRATGPEWERLSLGCSSQVKLLESAIAEGFETMESGLGHYEYKVLLGGKEHRVVNLRCHATSRSSRLRTKACLGMRHFLVLASQKVWYQRVSPHLPKALRSGQSETTIAFDF
jgi:CelD/BcsL family acetyltransferase involved in cellulose biosynthesis